MKRDFRCGLARSWRHCGIALPAWLSLGLANSGHAAVEAIADYRVRGSTPQITYTSGPEILVDAADRTNPLARVGYPRFFASAPSVPSAQGAGAIAFDGSQDARVRAGALFGRDDHFGLEVWVSADEASEGLKGIVAEGNGAPGYVGSQSAAPWVAFVGCVGAFDIGPVTPDRWTHLALVNDGKELAAFLNGARVRGVSFTLNLTPNFEIGTAGLPTEHFKGLVHPVLQVPKAAATC